MPKLLVAIHMDLTLAHVKLDFQGTAKAAMVGQFWGCCFVRKLLKCQRVPCPKTTRAWC